MIISSLCLLQGLFKPDIPFFIVTVGQLVVFELLGLFVISYFGTGWLPWLLSAFLVAAGQVCLMVDVVPSPYAGDIQKVTF